MSSSQDGLFPHPGGEQLPLDVPDTEAVLPLDMPQQFTDATSYEVRDKFQEMVGRDLLGPWDGETEQFKPRAMGPRERYLVGMLGPKHVPKSSVDEADTASDTESSVHGDTKGEGGGDLPEVLTPQNLGRIWASSMGLSFAVDADIDALPSPSSGGSTRNRRPRTRTERSGPSGAANRSSSPRGSGSTVSRAAGSRSPRRTRTAPACSSPSRCGRGPSAGSSS